jgi:Catalytic LigB subunit of aromatic ring-opening dioxygenase
MAEILGLGMTHAPMFQFPDENMADILRLFLAKDSIPASRRDRKNWPSPMQAEWGDDDGLSAARRHRDSTVASFRKLRDELEAFDPDFVLVWGDDQYENFKEDVVPSFCVYIYDELNCRPYANSPIMKARSNVWSQPPDKLVPVRGHREAAGYLARELIRNDFDIAFAYKPHHHPTLAHAFMRTLLYLDYDQKGFSWPIIPFHVNCYGSEMMEQAKIDGPVESFPPAPNPRRCYDLGKAVASVIGGSKYRAAVVGSSSWSHAFLTKKHDGLFPDVESDRVRFGELKAGNQYKWRDLTLDALIDAGQHELLNWICLAGAMDGRKPDYLDMVETYIFNSTKVSAVFRP